MIETDVKEFKIEVESELRKDKHFREGIGTYTIKSENLSLTFCEMSSQNLPSPPWEGMKGRGD